MNWISVNDRLPEEGQNCLFFTTDWEYEIGGIGSDLGEAKVWLAADGLVPIERVTHWMPLPEPPEVEE